MYDPHTADRTARLFHKKTKVRAGIAACQNDIWRLWPGWPCASLAPTTRDKCTTLGLVRRHSKGTPKKREAPAIGNRGFVGRYVVHWRLRDIRRRGNVRALDSATTSPRLGGAFSSFPVGHHCETCDIRHRVLSFCELCWQREAIADQRRTAPPTSVEEASMIFAGKKAARKAPNPVDKHVGSRVRMRRKMLKMTQEKLGDRLGITFQQVQKYEKGTNRISASRLQQAAHILQVPIPFFFEGAPGKLNSDKSAPSPAYVNEFVSSSEGLRLIDAFIRIDKAQEPARRAGRLTVSGFEPLRRHGTSVS
jgi:transcriptional regulator with XRE-family HTH domain